MWPGRRCRESCASRLPFANTAGMGKIAQDGSPTPQQSLCAHDPQYRKLTVADQQRGTKPSTYSKVSVRKSPDAKTGRIPHETSGKTNENDKTQGPWTELDRNKSPRRYRNYARHVVQVGAQGPKAAAGNEAVALHNKLCAQDTQTRA